MSKNSRIADEIKKMLYAIAAEKATTYGNIFGWDVSGCCVPDDVTNGNCIPELYKRREAVQGAMNDFVVLSDAILEEAFARVVLPVLLEETIAVQGAIAELIGEDLLRGIMQMQDKREFLVDAVLSLVYDDDMQICHISQKDVARIREMYEKLSGEDDGEEQ